MKVSIKSFDVNMEVKSRGIEFEVRDTQDKLLGDCYLTMTGLIWCQGRTSKQNGKKISWDKFIEMMSGTSKKGKTDRKPPPPKKTMKKE